MDDEELKLYETIVESVLVTTYHALASDRQEALELVMNNEASIHDYQVVERTVVAGPALAAGWYDDEEEDA